VDKIMNSFQGLLLEKKIARAAIPDTSFYAIDSAHI
jgi:hypothetical protein